MEKRLPKGGIFGKTHDTLPRTVHDDERISVRRQEPRINGRRQLQLAHPHGKVRVHPNCSQVVTKVTRPIRVPNDQGLDDVQLCCRRMG